MWWLTLAALAQDHVATGGEAPDTNIQWFRPSIDSVTSFRLTAPRSQPDGASMRGTASYTFRPIEYTAADGTRTAVIGHLTQIDAAFGWTMDRVRIGANVPLVTRSFGGSAADSTGLGDLSLDAKAWVGRHEASGIGLATSVRAFLPTSTLPAPLAGGFGVEVEVAADRAFREWTAIANLGAKAHPVARTENVTLGPELRLGVGASYLWTADTHLIGELLGASSLSDFGNGRAHRIEALVGASHRAGPVLLRPALVVGLGDAVGTPPLRIAFAIANTPERADSDNDGVPNARDGCPDLAEDDDRYEDRDGCPEPTLVTFRVFDANGAEQSTTWRIGQLEGQTSVEMALNAGPHDVTIDGVAYAVTVPEGPPTSVSITLVAPARLDVRIVDGAGQPVQGATWQADGPLQLTAQAPGIVPVPPGEYTLTADAPGFRAATRTVTLAADQQQQLQLTLAPSQAQLTGDRIDIKASVQFESGSSVVASASHPLLDEVAEILLAHPEITLLRVEGHTDSRGSRSDNLKLSRERAAAVRDYLIGRGVDASRVEAQGYGESRPLVRGRTEAAYAQNRRVDFVVDKRSD